MSAVAEIMSAVAEILTTAADLVAHGWTQAAYARDEFDLAVIYADDAATCFCASGAIFRACYDLRLPDPQLRVMAVQCVEDRLQGRHLPAWNDAEGRTQGEVVAALHAAAAALDG
jgi:hypothetical protein